MSGVSGLVVSDNSIALDLKPWALKVTGWSYFNRANQYDSIFHFFWPTSQSTRDLLGLFGFQLMTHPFGLFVVNNFFVVRQIIVPHMGVFGDNRIEDFFVLAER
jgi:hypothetical protein